VNRVIRIMCDLLQQCEMRERTCATVHNNVAMTKSNFATARDKLEKSRAGLVVSSTVSFLFSRRETCLSVIRVRSNGKSVNYEEEITREL